MIKIEIKRKHFKKWILSTGKKIERDRNKYLWEGSKYQLKMNNYPF